ncbi:MAG TPA: orotate phosphoribosyltransferase [Arachidicoccus soli]|uniref:Orotate phosphoribosyltransferase n=1 Tax=Arachidicoccus soli TaxID=2341117 RepID=A0A386HNI0_9BACT|nr:orotate phosphoribosyltransferase [Arachidicoccus soli]AYD47166.1 orotate phosphoribosyltransferase [Arachidicoccus soli]HEU0226379.1 orotate phosphoribosyltransferase [Arachidicoccus soli]
MSTPNEKVIAEKLLQASAVKLNIQQPFTWTSGWKSPIYCDNRKLLSFPFLRDFVKSELCNTVFESYPEAEAIAGVATAGIPWGAMVADQLKLPFMYVRPKPKAHGLGNQIEGSYQAGQKVVMIEDLISTGKSSVEAINVLKAENVDVISVVSIFNYDFTTAIEAFENVETPFKSLTNYPALISLAIEKSLVNAVDEPSLLAWRNNPSEWGK